MVKVKFAFMFPVIIILATLVYTGEPIKDLSIGNKWYYKKTGRAMGSGRWQDWIIEQVVGDTLIDSTIFKKIQVYTHERYYFDDKSIYPCNYISYQYENSDTNNVEIAYFWGQFKKYVLYDFNWNTGDNFYLGGPVAYPFEITVTATGDTLLWGQQFNYIKIKTNEYRWDPNTNNYFIIDKIGIVEITSYYDDNWFYKQLTGAVIDGVMYGDTTSTLAVKKDDPAIPASMVMLSNYPNPFNMGTTIEFTLPVNSDIKLTIYNSLGQRIKGFAEKYASPGAKSVQWDGCDDFGNPVPSGIYLYYLQLSNGQSLSNKMLLLK